MFGKVWSPCWALKIGWCFTWATSSRLLLVCEEGKVGAPNVAHKAERPGVPPKTGPQNGGHPIVLCHNLLNVAPGISKDHSQLDKDAVGQNQWYHCGVGAPPILEPILVVGLGCSLQANRDFDPLSCQCCSSRSALSSLYFDRHAVAHASISSETPRWLRLLFGIPRVSRGLSANLDRWAWRRIFEGFVFSHVMGWVAAQFKHFFPLCVLAIEGIAFCPTRNKSTM